MGDLKAFRSFGSHAKCLQVPQSGCGFLQLFDHGSLWRYRHITVPQVLIWLVGPISLVWSAS